MTDDDASHLDDFVRRAPRARVHPVRLVLSIAALIAVALVLWPTTDELRYHFHRGEPLDLGDAAALPPGTAVPVGARVRTHVVLGNHAAEIPLLRVGALRTGPVVVRSVMGAPLFIEYDPALHPTWGAFVSAEVDARVAPLELAEVRGFIERQGLEIPPNARVLLVDERPGAMDRYVFAWTAGVALALWIVLGLVRLRLSGRPTQAG